MSTLPAPSPSLGFGSFEIDLNAGELRKFGRRIRLQQQPFRVLTMLVMRAGQVVTREELQQQIWGDETFVDFEQGLNFCIRQIRSVLGDNAKTPRYVETYPRRGYRLLMPAKGSESSIADIARQWRHREIGKGRRPGLAVLPFRNLDSDPDHQCFADGLTEALIANLAQAGTLAVSSRTSSMQYKDEIQRISVVARELRADLIVEGAVAHSKDRARMTVRVFQGRTERNLWAETYERDLLDPLAVQDEIARIIAEEIKIKFAPRERHPFTKRPNLDVHVTYLRGRYYWNKRTPAAVKRAIEYFERAVADDPGYAAAYAGLADCYAVLGGYDLLPPNNCFPRAKTAALKALELDPELAEARTSLGFVRVFYDWDWQGAEREFRRALEFDPTHANAHHWLGMFLAAVGRMEEAFSEIEQARQLDPLSLIIDETLGWIYHFAREYDRAIEQYRLTLEMDANFLPAHEGLGLAFEQKSMFKEAVEEFEKAVVFSGRSPRTLAALGHAHAVAGNHKKAMNTIRELKQLAKQRYVSSYDIALIYLGIGEKVAALNWLERAYSEHSTGMIWFKVEPRLDALRPEPRFQGLLQRTGLNIETTSAAVGA